VAANLLGGIRSYLLYNAPYLLQSGYRFTIVAPENDALDVFRSDAEAWPHLELVGVPASGRRFTLWRSVRRALISGRFALVHSQGLRAGAETAFANIGIGVPHVITLHDVIVPQNNVPGRMKWLKKRIAARLVRRADAIVPVSDDCAENHLHHFPEWTRGHCRIEVIHNGVDVDELKRIAGTADKDALRNQLGIPGDVTLVGFFGRLMPQKGFEVLLDAIRQLSRLGHAGRVRVLATKDPHGYGPKCIREVAKDRLLTSAVQFVEPVSQIAQLLSQIDLLVMPSLWEACPLLAAEAMVLGVPVVGSDAIGLREVLRGSPSLVVPNGQPAALADALVRAVFCPWTAAARAYASEAQSRFDVRLSAERLWRLFEALTA
jgi:glycosyltransferase involved in cell wall biosynthesis